MEERIRAMRDEGPVALRVPPHVVRSFWNDEPQDAHLVIVSTRIDDVDADVEIVPDFWPA